MFIRAMAIFEGPSGLPTDRYVNNFHFNDFTATPPAGGDYVAVGSAIALAYEGVASFLQAEVTFPEIRMYDMDEPTPREPTFFLPGPASQPSGVATRLPREVALCLSYYGDRNIPRQRGRLYFGPLAAAVDSSDRPPLALRQALIQFGYDLYNALDGEAARWIVHSPTINGKTEITDLWVDDAWDTMRSRGSEPSSRIVHDLSTGAPVF